MSTPYINLNEVQFWQVMQRVKDEVSQLGDFDVHGDMLLPGDAKPYEKIYMFETIYSDWYLFICSSIDVRDLKFRECGNDSIQVVPCYVGQGVFEFPSRFKRVHRVVNFEKNLMKRIYTVLDWIKENQEFKGFKLRNLSQRSED